MARVRERKRNIVFGKDRRVAGVKILALISCLFLALIACDISDIKIPRYAVQINDDRVVIVDNKSSTASFFTKDGMFISRVDIRTTNIEQIKFSMRRNTENDTITVFLKLVGDKLYWSAKTKEAKKPIKNLSLILTDDSYMKIYLCQNSCEWNRAYSYKKRDLSGEADLEGKKATLRSSIATLQNFVDDPTYASRQRVGEIMGKINADSSNLRTKGFEIGKLFPKLKKSLSEKDWLETEYEKDVAEASRALTIRIAELKALELEKYYYYTSSGVINNMTLEEVNNICNLTIIENGIENNSSISARCR